MCIIKANGAILQLSDIVSVGVYTFEEYEILGNIKKAYDAREREKVFVVGHAGGIKPFEENIAIAPTGTSIVSDRNILDSLLILASKALPISGESSSRLVHTWCTKYGLPFCSNEASQRAGYLAFPLYRFYDFLFLLRDTFWKVESMYEKSSAECGIDNLGMFGKNPYKQQSVPLGGYFTDKVKESLISEFISRADLRLCFEYRNGTPTFYNYAPDIVSLATYQFALTLVSNGESVPRRCKCCGSMFFAHRKNKLYGPCCTRQKRYAAEMRKKQREKKELESNG